MPTLYHVDILPTGRIESCSLGQQRQSPPSSILGRGQLSQEIFPEDIESRSRMGSLRPVGLVARHASYQAYGRIPLQPPTPLILRIDSTAGYRHGPGCSKKGEQKT